MRTTLSGTKIKSKAVSVAVEAYGRRQRIVELLALRGRLRFDRAVLSMRHRGRRRVLPNPRRMG